MKQIQHVVIVGGGTAGWLTASLIAAKHQQQQQQNIKITLIESSDIPTIGVGEGTWPTLKNTLQMIGISEKTFFQQCNAVFKQGGKFVNWHKNDNSFYYHPFTVPLGYGRVDVAPYLNDISQFATQSNFQQAVCEAGLAPKSLADAEFKSHCNYAYHLDAGAFAELLKKHCKEHFAVNQVIDTVEQVQVDQFGNIASLQLKNNGVMNGDFFVDCTGLQSLLLGKALNVPFISKEKYLFNNRALAVQVPYETPNDEIAGYTIATGNADGWTWDIGLTHRRGTGMVYSSHFCDDNQAELRLRQYLGKLDEDLTIKKIAYEAGHREKWWHKNCVAVGMAAGFVEPLEATAIMLIEQSGRFIADNLPPSTNALPAIEARFNKQMAYRWQRIIDFLKLHYMLTERTETYWQAHKNPETWPDSLKADLAIWQYRGPQQSDFEASVELFPVASYQYVMYGMGYQPNFAAQGYLYQQQQLADQIINNNMTITQQLLNSLPKHRQYIESWLAKE